ncbi:MAG: hypothetical protein JWQ90_4029 [Hydrocarboniphaga sp.]|uniref:hypothetical protein n=1 Tax=Hydrocarboniphaga sp. TaxID=2033016 RepID=UPI00262EEA2B|nr:hypothetical protein [Hydrocarboniphaga sp.]MDB5971579.1 hypothetical protein [Hydrocarboniphaga sp.]
MILDKNEQAASVNKPWGVGDIFGLEIPADAETLVSNGTDFLTKAFHASGALAAHNSVSRIVQAQEFLGGGTGKKLLLTVAYELSEPGLPEQLFIKFSRNFDNALWDRARFLMISEANFAVLSRSPDFPVTVPACLFADIESESGTGLIISECISYGRNGMEAIYPKCMDYAVPEPLEHYKAILRGLAKLSGTHRGGRLPPDFDKKFPYKREQASAVFAIQVPEEKLIQRANRMFDFIARYPKLFPENVRTLEFRQQFIRDIPDVLAAASRIREVLYGNPDFIAFAHWNANIDNCWFWRDAEGALQCGFIDWANVGQISVAQSISGSISGAEPLIWNEHLDELLTVYIEEYVAHGGPRLSLEDLRLHNLLIVAVSGVAYSMGAPIAIERDIKDIDAVESYRDACFLEHENARIQLHMMTKMLNVWQTRKLGDVVRKL